LAAPDAAANSGNSREVATTLEAVDPQHPDVVASVNRPLALFAVGMIPRTLRRTELLGADQISSGSSTWQVKSEAGFSRSSRLHPSATNSIAFIIQSKPDSTEGR
jgi:hypothetical protein